MYDIKRFTRFFTVIFPSGSLIHKQKGCCELLLIRKENLAFYDERNLFKKLKNPQGVFSREKSAKQFGVIRSLQLAETVQVALFETTAHAADTSLPVHQCSRSSTSSL